MSVTFSVDGVARRNVKPYPDEDYEESVPVEPFFEINMSNDNAADFVDLLNFGGGTYGKWGSKEQLVEIQGKLCALLYTDAKVQFLEPTMRQGDFVMCGRDEGYVNQRLTQFLKLVTLAIVHGKTISWG